MDRKELNKSLGLPEGYGTGRPRLDITIEQLAEAFPGKRFVRLIDIKTKFWGSHSTRTIDRKLKGMVAEGKIGKRRHGMYDLRPGEEES